ncbi:hypothetical protein VHEMI09554 [[Torrubiella] hemipterigena]|uniref:FAD-dependent oxidoreductase-like enzyme n=1 Tax=[Torrubiella] hemipterigena TaxID=1531966 RepID=A0A0A1TRP6_9HYPO|nr:hypothetical protein VHEMI09554 [[Torrubiella] hemipterigena]
MASARAAQADRLNSSPMDDQDDAPTAPATPRDSGPNDIPLSQVTMPSTEPPGSPLHPNSSFKTEYNDDRPSATVIPSSMTPPPSTQADTAAVAATSAAARRGVFTQPSQHSTLCSPPATVPNTARIRDAASEFVTPTAQQIDDASADELRTLLHACTAENQRLKMETAHHKLQFNLFRMQAEEESMRAAVEHDMVRREVDALRMAEHSRQARRELSSSSDSMQSKYLQIKVWYDGAMDDNELLQRRLKVAKKVIQQKEEETISLTEERDMLLNRIRENREHFHMLCSPGGIFHAAIAPRNQNLATPAQVHRASSSQQSQQRLARDGPREENQHGLSALLQAMSQDSHGHSQSASQAVVNSTPTTPTQLQQHQQLGSGRRLSKHSRNAQSMSSLPTTPTHRARGEHAALLPSVDLVPQTEPRMRYADRYFEASASSRSHMRRKSRESTISAEDTDDAPYGSQASQAAAQMLRLHPGKSFDGPPSHDNADGRIQAKLSNIGRGDKRKFSSSDEHESGSPKRVRTEEVGLGIQYQR